MIMEENDLKLKEIKRNYKQLKLDNQELNMKLRHNENRIS